MMNVHDKSASKGTSRGLEHNECCGAAGGRRVGAESAVARLRYFDVSTVPNFWPDSF